MPFDRLERTLNEEIGALRDAGTLKGDEDIVDRVVRARDGRGPRFLLQGHGDREFVRMNSNSYLGLSLRDDVIAAEEEGSRRFGAGPGAVRFISGTLRPHVELEAGLAAYHGREAAMIFSSAYATIMGALTPLITGETLVISDELNHNCIINAVRLSRPGDKKIYRHLDMNELEDCLAGGVGKQRRAMIITDGIFSMRGDHAPLSRIVELARRFDAEYPENVVVVVDDSHGVGAFGGTGRGTTEHTGAEGVDILVATLGKALGVNGGYVSGSRVLVDYLREKAPFYIYSNPITPGEALAALRALQVLDGPEGAEILAHLRAMTARFRGGLTSLGYETLPGDHPVVPLMVRDTRKTTDLVAFLKENGVLATGLNFPVVPRGDESIRFQVSGEHTPGDIDQVLAVLERFPGRG